MQRELNLSVMSPSASGVKTIWRFINKIVIIIIIISITSKSTYSLTKKEFKHDRHYSFSYKYIEENNTKQRD